MMWKGVLLAVAASTSWALANVAIQRTGRAMGPIRALFWAQLTALPASAAVSLLLEPHDALPSVAVLAAWSLLAGLAGLVAYVPLFDAFEHGELSIVVPIASSWSVITTVIDVMLGEPLRGTQAVGTCLVLLGIVLIAHRPSVHGEAPSPAHPAPTAAQRRRAVGGAAIAAVSFGIMIPALRKLNPHLGSVGSVTVSYAVGLSVGLPVAGALRMNMRPPRRDLWPWVIATGTLETLGFVLVNLAQQHAPLTVVGPAASLSPGITVAYASLLLGERPGRVGAIGGALASVGLLLLGT